MFDRSSYLDKYTRMILQCSYKIHHWYMDWLVNIHQYLSNIIFF